MKRLRQLEQENSRLRELVAERDLERQGHTLGTDRMYRLWRQAQLQVPKKSAVSSVTTLVARPSSRQRQPGDLVNREVPAIVPRPTWRVGDVPATPRRPVEHVVGSVMSVVCRK